MLKVYIADDSAEVRKRLVDMVVSLDRVELVGQAGEVCQAITDILRLRPDVAILDIHFPAGSGFQVLDAAMAIQPAPRVIILTAFPYPQYRARCLQAGAKYFFDKSSEFGAVMDVVAGLSEESRPVQ